MRDPLAPIGYVYMADIHCPSCARDEFGDALNDSDTRDAEGNTLGAVAPWDAWQFEGDSCHCGQPIA